jgi:hypothetical protein
MLAPSWHNGMLGTSSYGASDQKPKTQPPYAIVVFNDDEPLPG